MSQDKTHDHNGIEFTIVNIHAERCTRWNDFFSDNLQKILNYLGEDENFRSVTTCDLNKPRNRSFYRRYRRLRSPITTSHRCRSMTNLPPVPTTVRRKELLSISPDRPQLTVRNVMIVKFWLNASFPMSTFRFAKSSQFGDTEWPVCDGLLVALPENSFGSESPGFSQPPRIPPETSYGKLRPVSENQKLVGFIGAPSLAKSTSVHSDQGGDTAPGDLAPHALQMQSIHIKNAMAQGKVCSLPFGNDLELHPSPVVPLTCNIPFLRVNVGIVKRNLGGNDTKMTVNRW